MAKLFLVILLLGSICQNSKAASDEDLVVEALEKRVQELDIELLVSEQVAVAQKIDGGVTSYEIPKEGLVLFTHSSDDSGKQVIVLRSSEDKLVSRKSKRVYIVLRKKEPNLYYATVAAIRDASKADKDTVNINGVDKAIEWLPTDPHFFTPGELKATKFVFCATTFVTACAFNSAVLVPADKFVPSAPSAFVDPGSVILKDTLLASDGSNGDDNYDLLADIEAPPPKAPKGRWFGGPSGGGGVLGNIFQNVGNIIGTTVNGAYGILCGVVGVVLGNGCTQPGGEGAARQETSETQTVVVNGPPIILPTKTVDAPPPAEVGGVPPPPPARRKRNPELDPYSSYPGWKTQFTKAQAGSSLKYDNYAFYGFGNCPGFDPVDPKGLDAAKSPEEIGNFYLKVLRIDCLADRKAMLDALIADKILVASEKRLIVNADYSKVASPKWSLNDNLKLTGAHEWCAFTSTYVASQTEAIDPKGESKSIHVFSSFVINYITGITKNRSHFAHLSRHLLLIIKSVLTKVSADRHNLESCADCAAEKAINVNELKHVINLLEFVRYGLGPVERGQEEARDSFEKFVKNNSASLNNLYELH